MSTVDLSPSNLSYTGYDCILNIKINVTAVEVEEEF